MMKFSWLCAYHWLLTQKMWSIITLMRLQFSSIPQHVFHKLPAKCIASERITRIERFVCQLFWVTFETLELFKLKSGLTWSSFEIPLWFLNYEAMFGIYTAAHHLWNVIMSKLELHVRHSNGKQVEVHHQLLLVNIHSICEDKASKTEDKCKERGLKWWKQ